MVQGIIKNNMPESLKGIKLLEKEDLKLADYREEHSSSAGAICKMDLKALETKELRTYLVHDFNSNGRTDIAIACIGKEDNKSYLIIVEKEKNTYKYVQHFTFNTRRLFLFTGKAGNLSCAKIITICFQAGTDWCEQVTWKKGGYVMLEQDPYGP